MSSDSRDLGCAECGFILYMIKRKARKKGKREKISGLEGMKENLLTLMLSPPFFICIYEVRLLAIKYL